MSFDENPNDNDPHGECESEIRYLTEMLESVYDQCGNHRAADRRHCLQPSLRDQIQVYLQATGRRSGVAEHENKGDGMTELTAAELVRHRMSFENVIEDLKNEIELKLQVHSDYTSSILWASERIAELEAESPISEIAWCKTRIKKLELENENLSKTILVLSNSPTVASQESVEETHQRQRRERMLDEVTLICVRDRIEQLIDAGGEQLETGATTEQTWGRNSRDTADNICRGIDHYDTEH